MRPRLVLRACSSLPARSCIPLRYAPAPASRSRPQSRRDLAPLVSGPAPNAHHHSTPPGKSSAFPGVPLPISCSGWRPSRPVGARSSSAGNREEPCRGWHRVAEGAGRDTGVGGGQGAKRAVAEMPTADGPRPAPEAPKQSGRRLSRTAARRKKPCKRPVGRTQRSVEQATTRQEVPRRRPSCHGRPSCHPLPSP